MVGHKPENIQVRKFKLTVMGVKDLPWVLEPKTRVNHDPTEESVPEKSVETCCHSALTLKIEFILSDGSGGWVLTPPDMGPQGVLTPSPRHRIQWDTVGKRAVRILFECFLVVDIKEKFLQFFLSAIP